MSCHHDLGLQAPKSGNWSQDYFLVKDYPDIELVNIKKITASDNSPFGQFPIQNEINYTDINNDGGNWSGYLPLKDNGFYSVGQENGNGFLKVRTRLQKPDAQQDRQVDIYYCY